MHKDAYHASKNILIMNEKYDQGIEISVKGKYFYAFQDEF